MAPEFFGREIEVAVEGEVRTPVSFRLDDREYVIAEIIDAWPDYGFGKTPLRRHKWWLRHHRNYYKVRTSEGEVFEIYHDRGISLKHPKHRKWYLSRQL